MRFGRAVLLEDIKESLDAALEPILEPASTRPLPVFAAAARRLVERTGAADMADADYPSEHMTSMSSASTVTSRAGSSSASYNGDTHILSQERTHPARIPDDARGRLDPGGASQPCTFRRRSSASVLGGFDSLSGHSSLRAPASPPQRGIQKSKHRSAGLWLSPLVTDRRDGSSNETI